LQVQKASTKLCAFTKKDTGGDPTGAHTWNVPVLLENACEKVLFGVKMVAPAGLLMGIWAIAFAPFNSIAAYRFPLKKTNHL
jgi:hypothetical protein